jgi:glycosyltransferase involved in cell wall biosynthesis
VPWVIRDGSDGLLVRAGDIDALAGTLTRLVEDGALRQKMGEAGRARLEGEFDWSSKLHLVRQVCLEAIRRHRESGMIPAQAPCRDGGSTGA